ncbi:MAG: DegT/DnrJ/EryC1/StrS family aminotransferase [Vicinamibacterales bacterium]|nr:DegT/DnrJ/EryC1/StrS family aminotransferase [Vicinamibacterales bacterium]
MTGAPLHGTAATVRLARLEPMPAAYPTPWFPMLPALAGAGRRGDPVEPASRFLADDAVATVSGTSAIAWALRAEGIGAGDEVLLPAYHCPTMVFAVLASGASPVFVPVDERLDVQPAAVHARLTPASRALLLPHYFGQRQAALDELAGLCAARGVVLVEDCAHAYYGVAGGFLPGALGDYAIASTRKFFASIEGGAIVANRRPLRIAPQPCPMLGEAEALVRTIDRGLAARRRVRCWLEGGRQGVPEGPPTEEAARREAQPAEASQGEVAAAGDRRLAHWVTRTGVRMTNHARSASVRRARFAAWAETLRGLPGVEPFLPGMPDSGVPYVFPAVLGRGSEQFAALKRAGVQVWRWDRLAESDCPVSRRLALGLVQLPCQHTVADRAFDELRSRFADAVRQRGAAIGSGVPSAAGVGA